MARKNIVIFSLFIILSYDAQAFPSPKHPVDDTVIGDAGTNAILVDSLLTNSYGTNDILYPKHFGNSIQKNYRSSDFNYTATKPRESIWVRIKKFLTKVFDSIFGTWNPTGVNKYTVVVLKVLSVVIISFIVYFILRYVLSKNGRFWLSKKNENIQSPATGIEEDIHEINFPNKIASLESKGDYRSAVRFRFLLILKKLSDGNKIQWDVQKTNQDYIAELRETSIQRNFINLVRVFDYVWYGENMITREDYEVLKNKFEGFNIR